jgi:hypothetical protein
MHTCTIHHCSLRNGLSLSTHLIITWIHNLIRSHYIITMVSEDVGRARMESGSQGWGDGMRQIVLKATWRAWRGRPPIPQPSHRRMTNLTHLRRPVWCLRMYHHQARTCGGLYVSLRGPVSTSLVTLVTVGTVRHGAAVPPLVALGSHYGRKYDIRCNGNLKLKKARKFIWLGAWPIIVGFRSKWTKWIPTPPPSSDTQQQEN